MLPDLASACLEDLLVQVAGAAAQAGLPLSEVAAEARHVASQVCGDVPLVTDVITQHWQLSSPCGTVPCTLPYSEEACLPPVQESIVPKPVHTGNPPLRFNPFGIPGSLQVGTMGVGLTVCTLPGGMVSERLAANKMELGLGIVSAPAQGRGLKAHRPGSCCIADGCSMYALVSCNLWAAWFKLQRTA